MLSIKRTRAGIATCCFDAVAHNSATWMRKSISVS